MFAGFLRRFIERGKGGTEERGDLNAEFAEGREGRRRRKAAGRREF
jgi:hypothetical protein